MTHNPMIPDTNWGLAAKGFHEQQGPQVILCAACVIQLGVTAAPQQVVVSGGFSYCLDHLPRPTE